MDRGKAIQLGLVVAVHLALLAALLAWQPAREALVQIIPVMTRIVPPDPQPSRDAPAPPQKALPKPREATRPQPAVPTTAPILSAEPVPTAPPTPSAPVAVSPPVVASPPISAPPATAATAPFVPPRADLAYLNNPKPEYPIASRRLGEAGRVILNVQVSASGTVEQVNVQRSSGFERLDRAAVSAVRKWTFVPARRGSEAVAAQALVPISFSVDDD